MQIDGSVAIVTGAGNGIGAAIADGLARGGARVAVVDLDGAAADTVAAAISTHSPGAAIPLAADVSSPADLTRLVGETELRFGDVDIFFANAGIFGASGLGDSAGWARAIDVNLMAHVRAAEILLPKWLERGSGYFVSTASAAGLLTQLGMAPYSATKHAAVAFAEWLAITYGDRGIHVSCLCPMGVDTELLRGSRRKTDQHQSLAADAVVGAGEVLTSTQVAATVLAAVEQESFLILPHPEVLTMLQRKAQDPERWLGGMRRYQRTLTKGA